MFDNLLNPCYLRLFYFKQASLPPSATPALTLAPSIACSLFPIAKKVNSFGIKQIQPLFPKCRGGVGIPSESTGHPGWGPLLGDLWAKSCPRLTEGFLKLSTVNCRLLTTFRINTCKCNNIDD